MFNAVLHLDEATPHLHIDYIPIGHYNRGLDTQNGLVDQALKEMGYGGGKESVNSAARLLIILKTNLSAFQFVLDTDIEYPQKLHISEASRA